MTDELDEGLPNEMPEAALGSNEVNDAEYREQEADHHGDEELAHDVVTPETRAALVPQRG